MPATKVIDRAFEATSARLPEAIGRRRAWRGDEVNADDCVITLDDRALAEIARMIEHITRSSTQQLLHRAEQFDLPRLREHMQSARERLFGVTDGSEAGGYGVAVIDRLPMDDLQTGTATTLFFILGQLISRPVAQKWDGSMLYDVRDSGATYGYGVRGSTTNVELVFHTDNAFAICPPEVVGLMCVYPAREGGTSRFCSLYAVHEALREHHPQALERLYQPMLWDRQAEHAPNAAKVMRAPMFRCEDEQLLTRANVSLVRKGYDVAGEQMDDSLRDALSALETVSREPSLWFEQPIARGQLQYLNNVTTAHYRSHFIDHEDASLKRHLVRTWHRDHGLPGYDG